MMMMMLIIIIVIIMTKENINVITHTIMCKREKPVP